MAFKGRFEGLRPWAGLFCVEPCLQMMGMLDVRSCMGVLVSSALLLRDCWELAVPNKAPPRPALRRLNELERLCGALGHLGRPLLGTSRDEPPEPCDVCSVDLKALALRLELSSNLFFIVVKKRTGE